MRDLQADHTADLALADNPAALVDRVLGKLTYSDTAALRTATAGAVGSITIPTPTASNQAAVDSAKRARVNAAILLVLASPEYQVQQ